MRLVVHGVLEDHSNDPSDALDMQKGMNSVIRLQQRHGNGLACHRARFGLQRIAAVNNSVCGLATMPWRVTVLLSLFALGLQHRTRSVSLRRPCA
jgi:hypothetical protein